MESNLLRRASNGKILFAIAYTTRDNVGKMAYTHANDIEEVRVRLLDAKKGMPKGARLVGIAPAIGHFEYEDLLIRVFGGI